MSDAKKLEELNARRQKVQIEHAKLQAEVDAARREYDSLRADAEREFGTSKLPELEIRLNSIREANAAAIKTAESELSVAEAAILSFKREFAGAQNAA